MLTPERRAELREYAAGIVGVEQASMLAHPAEMLALLDAADERDRLARFLGEVRRQVERGALCPMCSTGMSRQTVGMVCQLCGTDYATPAAPRALDGTDE